MNLNISGARLLTLEEIKIIPHKLLAGSKPYWVKPDTTGEICPFIDVNGELHESSIYVNKWIRPVILVKEAIHGEQYEEITYSDSKWYILSQFELLSKDVVEEAYRFDFDKSSSNDFEDKDVRNWVNYTYKKFTKADITSFSDTYVIPEGVAIIDDEVFAGNRKLKKVVIPDSVERIGNSAFLDCTSIETVVLGDGLRTGGSRVFLHCKSIKDVCVKNLKAIFNYGCDNYGSPLQYGADLYVNGVRCVNVDIPEETKYPWLIYPLIGCGSVESISISKQTPCFDAVEKLIIDLNNGGENERYFTDGIIRKWELIIK